MAVQGVEGKIGAIVSSDLAGCSRSSGADEVGTRAKHSSGVRMSVRIMATVCALVGLVLLGQAANAAEVRLEEVSIYPGEFSPDPLIVKKGIPLRILVTTRKREHVNRLSILPWVRRSERLSPGKTTVIEFTPDQIGDFKIRNIGHGFTGILRVVE